MRPSPFSSATTRGRLLIAIFREPHPKIYYTVCMIGAGSEGMSRLLLSLFTLLLALRRGALDAGKPHFIHLVRKFAHIHFKSIKAFCRRKPKGETLYSRFCTNVCSYFGKVFPLNGFVLLLDGLFILCFPQSFFFRCFPVLFQVSLLLTNLERLDWIFEFVSFRVRDIILSNFFLTL